ncbi:hypothetical protein EC968_006034 [Mortierella alpina]|nr:hypothetical protein EC968_006034 [Mortierella alpina]
MKFITPLFSSMALIAMLCTGATAQAENSADNRAFGSNRFARANSAVAMFTKNHTEIATKVYTNVANSAIVRHEIARELHITYFWTWTSKHALSTKQSAELGAAVQEKIKERVNSELAANVLTGREEGYAHALTKSCSDRADNCVRKKATCIVNDAIEYTHHTVYEVSTKVLHGVNDNINEAIKAYGSRLFKLNLGLIKFEVKGDISLVEQDISDLLLAAPKRVRSECNKIKRTESKAIKHNQF